MPQWDVVRAEHLCELTAYDTDVAHGGTTGSGSSTLLILLNDVAAQALQWCPSGCSYSDLGMVADGVLYCGEWFRIRPSGSVVQLYRGVRMEVDAG